MKSKFARGQILDPNAGRKTFGEYATEALAARLLRPGTKANYDRHLARIWPI